MTNPFDKIHKPGLVAFVGVLGGLAASPAFLNVIPAKYAAALIAAASMAQAFTKPLPKPGGGSSSDPVSDDATVTPIGQPKPPGQ